jgi:hypothetical protein
MHWPLLHSTRSGLRPVAELPRVSPGAINSEAFQAWLRDEIVQTTHGNALPHATFNLFRVRWGGVILTPDFT